MTASDFLRKKEFTFSNIYYLTGDEEFMYEKVKKNIIENLGCSDLSMTYFNQSAALTDVINEANCAPFFDKYRIILLNDPAFLKPKKEKDEDSEKSGKDGEHNEADIDSEKMPKKGKAKAPREKSEADFFIDYLNNKLPQTTVVVLKQTTPDKRLTTYKAISKISCTIELNIPDGRDFIIWIKQTAKRKGLEIDDRRAQLITDICGSDMLLLDNEMDKLAMLGKSRISDDEIKKVLSATDEYNVFNLHDYMMNGKYSEAFKLARSIYADTKSFIPLTALLYNRFRLILAASQLKDSGKNDNAVVNELVSELKVKNFSAKQAVGETKKFTAEQLKEALKILADYDAAQKSGGADPGIEYILMKIYAK